MALSSIVVIHGSVYLLQKEIKKLKEEKEVLVQNQGM